MVIEGGGRLVRVAMGIVDDGGGRRVGLMVVDNAQTMPKSSFSIYRNLIWPLLLCIV